MTESPTTTPTASPATLSRLSTPTLSEAVTDALREQIVRHAIRPGERLVETTIASELGVSRGPVREAIAQLRAEGLVVDTPRRGAFVAKLSEDDISEIYELRAAIEGHAARLMVDHGNQAGIEELRQLYDKAAAAVRDDDREAYSNTVCQFHRSICEGSQQQRLVNTWDTSLKGLVMVLLHLDVSEDGKPLAYLLSETKDLLDSIESGDGVAAQNAVVRHTRLATIRLQKLIAER